ncbi:hypothetical protein [Photobacterium lipolyticum]|uniref:PEGA domain-containing protein n=1 Tax=Photobacterium lipolyticum TaxID=266810 RepID=A0A2T3N1N4_9GAMM|nr:hypothetical protein [Photobacterium lipolyticum]PSW06219.1 hypothetical protein C9I89_06845 [Photobacterium lipolyticum]
MLKKAIFLLSISAAFCAQGASLLTESELEQIKQVKEQYNNTTELKELTEVNSSIFTYTNQTAQLESAIIRGKKTYHEFQLKMSEEMLSGTEESTNYYFDSMKKVSKEIKSDQEKIKTNTALIAQNKKKIDKLNDAIRESNKIYNEKLTSLKENAVSRIKKEFASPIPIKLNGKLKCSPYQSIRECFENKQTNSKLVNDAIASRFGQINIKSNVNKFNVDSAQMDYDGNVTYNVSFNLFVQYNEDINVQIIKEIGVESFDVKLVSNQAASFYVNGLPVGEGVNVMVKIPKGQHSILAKYNGQQESTVQNITDAVSLTYNFES